MADRLSREAAAPLAAFIHHLRPDWDVAGILAALGNARLMGDAADLAVAAVAAARESSNRTPAVIAMQGPHWAHVAVRQKSSANATAPRTETCGICYMPRDKCRARWAADHEFESVADARARAIRQAENNGPRRRALEVLNGRPIKDVELP